MVDKPGPGSRVLVIGCGRSGVGATKLLRRLDADVTVLDDAPRDRLGNRPAEVEALGATTVLAPPPERPLPPAQWIVLSPGVPTETARFSQAVSAGATLVGEVALASWFCPAPILVVTGTNGKTTTATLVHHLLCAAGWRSVLAGNVGTAFSGVVETIDAEQVVVLEVSSYQLEHAVGFHPRVGAILNITPDHLDRYASLDAYAAAKFLLWDGLAADGVAVANAEDARVAARAATLDRRVVWFGPETGEADAATVEAGTVVVRRGGASRAVLPVAEIPLLGAHNVSNVLAALACASVMTEDVAALAEGARTFTGVEHRLQPVREVRGVLYVNDSKATNVSATATALRAMDRPVVLLLGGRGKGAGYRELVPLAEAAVREVIVYGEDAPAIRADLEGHVALTPADTFEGAVTAATRAARPGDVVLLSPACASFDMFENFEARGRRFVELVEAL